MMKQSVSGDFSPKYKSFKSWAFLSSNESQESLRLARSSDFDAGTTGVMNN
jgi:hypothetical protein